MENERRREGEKERGEGRKWKKWGWGGSCRRVSLADVIKRYVWSMNESSDPKLCATIPFTSDTCIFIDIA